MSSNSDKESNTLADISPLYHDFFIFGVSNKQLSDQFIQNQKAKAPLITAYSLCEGEVRSYKGLPQPHLPSFSVLMVTTLWLLPD